MGSMTRPRSLALVVFVLCLASLSVVVSQSPAAVISFRIIVVESRDAAERVLEQLRGGENFVALAARVSIDPSGRSGGLVSRVPLSDLRPQIRAALANLRVGELSPIFQLPTGFSVVKIVPDDETDAGATTSRAGGVMGSFASPLAATGSVKYVYDLSGYVETVLALRNAAAARNNSANLPALCDTRRQLVTSIQSTVANALAPSGPASSASSLDRAQMYVLKAQMHAFHGEMAPAIAALEQARAIAEADVPELRLQLDEALGIAHLHKAEQENGLYEQSSELDLLPARPGQRMPDTADLTAAIHYFDRYLSRQPDEYEVVWLLNIAHMYAGTYPGGVPKQFLIQPSALTSAEDVGRFVDVASRVGLRSAALSGGIIVDDFDDDGRLDLVTSSIDSCAPLRFFRRGPNGVFADQAAPAGLGDQLGGLNIVQADYNNDGHLDILVLRGAWEMPERKSLLRNNGDGTFTDVTVASGLAQVLTGTQAAAWTDVDNDGFLDLFVGNENGPAQLFHNNHDGTFTDVATAAGVDARGFNKGVTAGDYDNDGWPDLYVSNLGQPNLLYRNNHNGTFTELGRGANVPGPGQGFPTWFFDYDNDGYLDLFVGSFVTSVDEAARAYLHLPRNGQVTKLYRNLGDGSFQDVTREAGLEQSLMVMGANFGDVNNDGFLDMFLGTGNPSYGSLVPSLLLLNKGGQRFVDITGSSGTGELHKGHGVAFADLDHDGDEDIVFEVGGATPGDAHVLRLFENPGQGADWIALKLIGVRTNRSAIGARITVTVDGADGRRMIHRSVGSGGSFGASPLLQHVGLGRGARHVDVDVWWPTSSTRQHFADVGTNRFVEITELANRLQPLDRPLLPLGPRGAQP
jgi:hypothetical protein